MSSWSRAKEGRGREGGREIGTTVQCTCRRGGGREREGGSDGGREVCVEFFPPTS